MRALVTGATGFVGGRLAAELLGRGADVARLVRDAGRGAGGDFAERERRAARNFAGAAREAGVERVVYLGGLGEQPKSQHLRSRNETGRILGAAGPPLTYFRAAMVVGAGSESLRRCAIWSSGCR